MPSTIFNILLFAAVLYFYTTNNLFAVAGCALFVIYRIFQSRLTRMGSVLSRLNDVPSELGCDTILTCRFSVQHALSHPSVDELFHGLRSRDKVEAKHKYRFNRFGDGVVLLEVARAAYLSARAFSVRSRPCADQCNVSAVSTAAR